VLRAALLATVCVAAFTEQAAIAHWMHKAWIPGNAPLY
jgi:hypothetical protein